MDAGRFVGRLIGRGQVRIWRDPSGLKVIAEFASRDGHQRLTATDDDVDRAVFRLYELVEASQPRTPNVWTKRGTREADRD